MFSKTKKEEKKIVSASTPAVSPDIKFINEILEAFNNYMKKRAKGIDSFLKNEDKRILLGAITRAIYNGYLEEDIPKAQIPTKKNKINVDITSEDNLKRFNPHYFVPLVRKTNTLIALNKFPDLAQELIQILSDYQGSKSSKIKPTLEAIINEKQIEEVQKQLLSSAETEKLNASIVTKNLDHYSVPETMQKIDPTILNHIFYLADNPKSISQTCRFFNALMNRENQWKIYLNREFNSSVSFINKYLMEKNISAKELYKALRIFRQTKSKANTKCSWELIISKEVFKNNNENIIRCLNDIFPAIKFKIRNIIKSVAKEDLMHLFKVTHEDAIEVALNNTQGKSIKGDAYFFIGFNFHRENFQSDPMTITKNLAAHVTEIIVARENDLYPTKNSITLNNEYFSNIMRPENIKYVLFQDNRFKENLDRKISETFLNAITEEQNANTGNTIPIQNK